MGARTDIFVTHNSSGDVIPGVYLTNAAYTYYSMLNGDQFMGSAFKQGDWYKVIFKGTKPDGTTAVKEIYLADYRSENASEQYINTDWKWYDLSSLGVITKLSVTVDGSRKDNYGLTIPAYFCMDQFGAEENPTSGLSTSMQNEISVYPSSFTDYIVVKSTQRQSLKVFALSGQLLINTFVVEGENRLDVQSLPTGSYILQCGGNVVRLIK